uniref:Uncharacterized protein n=1 Tax=Solanum tuberosum TaxID=4113 RepID=M1B3C7_SOLTU
MILNRQSQFTMLAKSPASIYWQYALVFIYKKGSPVHEALYIHVGTWKGSYSHPLM